MKQRIRAFIIDNYMYGSSPDELDDEVSFLEAGIIDSTGVMELILFLEEEFGVHVEDAEMVPDNLDSVNRLCQYLERKGVSASAASANSDQ